MAFGMDKGRESRSDREDGSVEGMMGDLIEGIHIESCTKAHWCENHCPRRFESEGGSPSCDCDQFDDDDD